MIPENKLTIVPTKVIDETNVAEFASAMKDLLKSDA